MITEPPIQNIQDNITDGAGLELAVLRLDMIHPWISGNKWYKLKYNLEEAGRMHHRVLLTFGGAYSNHLYATAAAGKMFGFRTIGMVRGEMNLPLNPVLSFAQEMGMDLQYLDRNTYRQRFHTSFLAQLQDQYGPCYIIPEGGANSLGVRGCVDIITPVVASYDYLCCACGTGGTLAGLIAGTDTSIQKVGMAVLKGGDFLTRDVYLHLDSLKQYFPQLGIQPLDMAGDAWTIKMDYHFGGFAKNTPELQQSMYTFQQKHPLPLEHVYTGKMVYGVYDLIQKGYFPRNSRVLMVHTGGVGMA